MPVTAIALTLFYLVLFNFLIYRIRWLQLSYFKPWVSQALFNAKFAAGILLWVIYTFYYTDTANSDIHKFYNDALVLRNVADENVAAFSKLMLGQEDSTTATYTAAMKNWERNFDEAPINENRTIIRLNAAIMLLSFRSYFVHILFMCLISFIGWVLLSNSIFSNLQNNASALLALPVLFLPSVLFWTSGVMKEPVLTLGLGLFIHGLCSPSTIRTILFIALGSVLILASKFYVLACIMPATVAFFVSKRTQTFSAISTRYSLVYLVFLLAAFNVQHVVPRLNPMQMLANKQTHAIKEASYFNAGSRIEITPITGCTRSVTDNIPSAVWNCVARPYLWESKNPMMLLSALENVLVWVVILFCIFLILKHGSFSQANTVLFLLAFSLSYFALIGISTPVLGNLVRYKTPLVPLLLFGFVLMADLRKAPQSLRNIFLLNED